MKIYYEVRILPPLPVKCIPEDDLRRLERIGFYPRKEEGSDSDKVIFTAPIYILDRSDRHYSFIDDDGTWDAATEKNSLYGILVRIMKLTGLSYIYITMIDQLISRENTPD